MTYKTHKITLDPTFRQRRWFSAQCGYARFAYNKGLEDFKASLAQGISQSWITLNNNFNKRKNDAHHKATTDIVNRASAIGIETLKVTNMLKNQKLAKALSDSALGGFLSMLKSKTEARGIPTKEADQFFASSKTCSRCGHKKRELDLSERTYHCRRYGISIDRDVNAAINLRPITVG